MSTHARERSLVGRLQHKLLVLAIITAETVIRCCTASGRLAYHDCARFPWTADLAQDWPAIRREIDVLLAERAQLPNFQDVSTAQRVITDDNRWKVFFFSVFGTPITANCMRCPHTAAALQKIPGLQNAMFSILAPGKAIPPHRGPYNGLLRYHLGLKVPAAAAECVIRVDGRERHWREGAALIFDDSYEHEVRNATDDERVVLFADFERPLAWPLAVVNRALIRMLARTPLAREPLEYLQPSGT